MFCLKCSNQEYVFMVYFRELNYLPSSRFSDFVGCFSRKEEERRNYRVHKTTFAIHS